MLMRNKLTNTNVRKELSLLLNSLINFESNLAHWQYPSKSCIEISQYSDSLLASLPNFARFLLNSFCNLIININYIILLSKK